MASLLAPSYSAPDAAEYLRSTAAKMSFISETRESAALQSNAMNLMRESLTVALNGLQETTTMLARTEAVVFSTTYSRMALPLMPLAQVMKAVWLPRFTHEWSPLTKCRPFHSFSSLLHASECLASSGILKLLRLIDNLTLDLKDRGGIVLHLL